LLFFLAEGASAASSALRFAGVAFFPAGVAFGVPFAAALGVALGVAFARDLGAALAFVALALGATSGGGVRLSESPRREITDTDGDAARDTGEGDGSAVVPTVSVGASPDVAVMGDDMYGALLEER
jgi:hypothetical protein